MTVQENYYREIWAEHDEIRTTVKKMIHARGLKISIRGGYWTIHKDPWYNIFTPHKGLITIIYMGFRWVPQVTVNDREYKDLAQQIAAYLDLKLGNKEEGSQ